MIRIQTAEDLMSAGPWERLLIYGDTGSGKTTWMARSPRPLILLTEPQGAPAVRLVAPKAMVVLVQTPKALYGMLDALMEGAPAEVDGQAGYKFRMGKKTYVFQTLGLDSLADIQEILIAKILSNRLGAKATRDRLADKMSRDDWGVFAKMLRSLLRDFRNLPCHLVCVAHATHTEEGTRYTRPAMSGTVGKNIGYYFNGVGFSCKVKRDGQLTHGIVWDDATERVVKPPPGWPPFIVNTMEEGVTTLGSLSLATRPGANVPAMPGDNKKHVQSKLEGGSDE